jgi:type 1 fimbria pilin
MMKRFTLVGLAALAVVGALAATASATPPTHATITFTGSDSEAAGTLCDFNLSESFSGTNDWTFFSDGSAKLHQTIQVSHVNDDTGFTLTETDVVNLNFNPDGSAKNEGLFWHLRDASGKLVVVHAGQFVFDSLGNLVKFTPNSGPDFAAVICPALGGNPA